MHNEVHHGKGVGVLVCDNAKGVIEDNVISCNGRAGIAILSGGDPLVCANKIHDGMDSGAPLAFTPSSSIPSTLHTPTLTLSLPSRHSNNRRAHLGARPRTRRG